MDSNKHLEILHVFFDLPTPLKCYDIFLQKWLHHGILNLKKIVISGGEIHIM
jgi:hypothetical protein